MSLCSATTKKGRPCKRTALASGLCSEVHDPQAASVRACRGVAAKQAKRAALAATPRAPVPARTIDDLRSLVEMAVDITLASRATAATRANILLKACTTALAVIAAGDTAADLEQVLALLRQHHPDLLKGTR